MKPQVFLEEVCNRLALIEGLKEFSKMISSRMPEQRLRTPEVGGWEMKKKRTEARKYTYPLTSTKGVAIASIFGALYIALLTTFAPISFLQIQVRIADALTIVSVFFGLPAIFGMTIGHMIINYSFTPIIPLLDLLTPVGACLPGLLIMYKWRNNKAVVLGGSMLHNLMVGAWVAMMLHLAFGLPFYFSWLTVFVGETIAVTVIGYPVYLALEKRGLLPPKEKGG